MRMIWQCGRFALDLTKPKIMGVLNSTPDSFSDGGLFMAPAAAIARAHEMVEQGADIIDVGAESTRPGARTVSSEEEIARLLPIVSALVNELAVPVSVDTQKTATMRAMLDLGVDIINDVNALEDIGALEVVQQSQCGICLMHMRGTPENMQANTEYDDVVFEVREYLDWRVKTCLQAGIAAERLAVDPGFGFGKTPDQNMRLVKNAGEFGMGKYPLLLGVSRKSTIGHILGGVSASERMVGSVTLAMLGVLSGAKILRVHDVRETRDALKVLDAYHSAQK